MISRHVLVALVSTLVAVTAAWTSAGDADGRASAADLERIQAFWADLYGEVGSEAAPGAPPFAARVLAKAKPDECYHGLGEANVYPFDFDAEDCDPGTPKVNESYVFGLTRSGDDLWFGTAPNMGCLVYGGIADVDDENRLVPFDTHLWACEYGIGQYGQALGLPAAAADWRPPSIYAYDTSTGELHDVTPDDPLLLETLGLRSAGSIGNVVFLAGPSVTGAIGVGEQVNMFAFRADTREYLGSASFPEYINIRKWVAAGGVLYTGVRVNPAASPEGPAGEVLRWVGTLADPFSFETVGALDGDAVELVEHAGRIFVNTWPIFENLAEEDYDYAGLWMSPPVGPDGLQPSDAELWIKVWGADDYETDELTARLYNGGALASFGGYLYWGTLHAPFSAGFAHAQVYGLRPLADRRAFLTGLLGTHRPISLFRGKDFGTPSEVQEVLYGMELMPTYVKNPLPGGDDRIWIVRPNKMGPPLYGPAGLGNWFNTYTWTMVSSDVLLVGTMDWSHMFTAVMLPVVLRDIIDPFPEIELPGTTHGADLFVFTGTDGPALELDRGGLGNYASYGVRTGIAGEGGVYLGMANAMNLMTDPDDERPEGGWELIRLERGP